MAGPTVCETRWGEIVTSFKNNHDDLDKRHPDCTEELGLIQTALHTIGQLIHISPTVNGNDALLKGLVAKAEAERTPLSKHLDGKALFTGILRLYAAIHREMNETLQSEQVELPTEFRKQKRRICNPSDKQGSLTSNTVVTGCGVSDSRIQPQAGLPTINFFAPLRTEMELEGTKEKNNHGERQGTTNQAGRPPPIILTSATNLLQLQKSIKGIVKGSFEFRNTKNRTRVLTKEIADFSAIKSFFLSKKLSFYTFSRNPQNL
jgi:hypothetical protein